MKYWPGLHFCMFNSSTAFDLKARGITLFSNINYLLIVSGATDYSSCSKCGSYLVMLCHSGGYAVPEVKSEKENIP